VGVRSLHLTDSTFLSLHLAEEDPVHSSLFSDISSQFRSNLDPSLLWEIERIVPRVVGVLG
jgi:hypothetical protein